VRVLRAFAFLDLCGFTSYAVDRGDAEAVDVLVHLRSAVRTEAEHTGVRVTKWLGDGAMLSGLDAESVISCCATVRELVDADGRLPLRAGVSLGSVIMFEGDDYVGTAVNTAARLCDAAAPGQVLATLEAACAMADRDAWDPVGTLSLRGFATPLEAVALTARRPSGLVIR
jgi:adenylate cyclase